ncbi:hypothetical protein [Jiulongibacter sp. NS-SX5]|uniref:hypothetical protein n=1 Tax=Jiulongibacter sp. NS-SX5 TaxID=3463854 RepID=UPI004059504D
MKKILTFYFIFISHIAFGQFLKEVMFTSDTRFTNGYPLSFQPLLAKVGLTYIEYKGIKNVGYLTYEINSNGFAGFGIGYKVSLLQREIPKTLFVVLDIKSIKYNLSNTYFPRQMYTFGVFPKIGLGYMLSKASSIELGFTKDEVAMPLIYTDQSSMAVEVGYSVYLALRKNGKSGRVRVNPRKMVKCPKR